ncbi:hypothetical protein GGQ74_000463 [Desulfobaculum xiamenense]|uniref:DUF374 domain-containing protein n=1 Tax=Desulfobaculum xiamenense TaxID=995050 RepID=A0A846QKW1_9BACT|nr:lysophospholipid acyltransferase family protein [Desulfobaculum xiamenense]NJB66823.1 hypothetical protein [Desulfobaculum xiamenense]
MKIKVDPVLLSYPLSWLYRLWCGTIRMDIENRDALERVWAQGRTVVMACWHNELFPYPTIQMNRQWTAIVSLSSDGTIATELLNRLGLVIARGSSSRGGVRALMSACRLIKKDGRQGFVTVDGPRGPRHEVKEGVIFLAQKSGSLLVPTRMVPSRAKIFDRSWDKFVLPLPFSRCRIVFGEPYEVTSEKLDEQTLAEETRKLGEKLHALV